MGAKKSFKRHIASDTLGKTLATAPPRGQFFLWGQAHMPHPLMAQTLYVATQLPAHPVARQRMDNSVLKIAFSVASTDSRQNDRVYAPRVTLRKCSIAAERLLRCRPTFSKSLMVSVAVSKLGCSPLFFVEPGVRSLLPRRAILKQQHAPYCWWHVRVPAG